DIDVSHGQHIVEIGDAMLDAEFIGNRDHALDIEVAEHGHLVLAGIGHIALDDMAAADAGADHRDVENPAAHRAHSVPFSASCWAVSAIFMALKARSCGMAVSVRLATSARNWRPKGRSTCEQSIWRGPSWLTMKR